MKKLFIILVLLFVSCTDYLPTKQYPRTRTGRGFIYYQVYQIQQNSKGCRYYLDVNVYTESQIDEVYIVDSCGVYKVGDRLQFKVIKIN